jgi:hypothetical protein
MAHNSKDMVRILRVTVDERLYALSQDVKVYHYLVTAKIILLVVVVGWGGGGGWVERKNKHKCLKRIFATRR